MVFPAAFEVHSRGPGIAGRIADKADTMNKNGTNPTCGTNLGSKDASQGEGMGSRPIWHRPNVTTIDIKRTMLILGSVIDGVSGSI